MRKGLVVLALAGGVALGGCNAQSAQKTGGAIGTVLGVVVGAAVGGNSNMGAAGGALFGGVAGFIAGSFVGQLVDEDRERQAAATQAALNGDGSAVYWASPKNPGKVYGLTEIVGTRTIPADVAPPGAPQTVTRPISLTPDGSYTGPAVYCLPVGGTPYRLEAPRCPYQGVAEISRDRYLAMVPDAEPKLAQAPAPVPPARKATADKPARNEGVQTASIPAEAPKATPPSAPVQVAPTEAMCRMAREMIWVEGKERVEHVEYCRAPGASAWIKKAA